MHYAKDGRGKLVTAWEAAAGLYYRCPECRADVFLKTGKKNVSHFAHRRGQGRAECELFHPSDYMSGLSRRHDFDNDSNAPPILPLLLSIELDPTPQSRLTGYREWKLALTVPKAPDTHGSVRIDCGIGTPRLIALSKLALNAQTYPASRTAEDFGSTWASPEVHPRYKAAIEHRVAGLNRLLVNVFANGRQKQKPLAHSLSWSGSYYLIWHDSLPIELPSLLSNSQLAKQDDWRCSIITLPDEEDEDLRCWFEEKCDLTIIQQRRRWSIVYPPPIEIDSLGNVTVASNQRLLLATFAPPKEDDEQAFLVASVGRATDSTSATYGRQFFAIEHDSKSDAAVAITWDGAPLPEITQTTSYDALRLLGVAFGFRSRSGAERYRCFLHHMQIEPLLQAVRRSEFDLRTISTPARFAGELRWRRALGDGWQTVLLPSERNDSTPEISNDAVEHANLILQDQSVDILLDFGALGSRYLTALLGRSRHPQQARLNLDTRQKLLWFCITANSYPRGVQLASLADDALLRHFGSTPTPSHLTAHRRHLEALVRTATRATA
jgi:hypothetical protein